MNQKNALLQYKNRLNNRARRWDDDMPQQMTQPQRTPQDLFETPSMVEKVRNGRVLGDDVQVADLSKTPIAVYEMTIAKFDVGRRVVVQDTQGFLHFVEPTWNLEASGGAVFVFQISPETKTSAGWKPEKNRVLTPTVQTDRRQKRSA